MGRHSSPSQGPFYRSIAGWATLWITIAVITGIGVWLIVKTIGGPEVEPTVGRDTTETAEAEPEPTEESTDDPVIVASVSPTAEPEETGDSVELITEGVTVQVLNGTLQPEAAQAMADRLGGLGYTVVTVEESSQVYQDTTVFWSADASREAAEALAGRFGWKAEPKPDNLSSAVSIHVVVGADETSG